MADLAQTAANVAIGSNAATIEIVQAGEAITQGNPVYFKTSDSKYWKTDADALASSLAAGIALTPAAANGYFVLWKTGLGVLGGTLVVGSAYYCSTNPGGICLIADLASGDFATLLGFAITTSFLNLDIVSASVAKA